MYYTITPLLFILVSVVIIIRIIVKKFPAVVNLDVNTLPQERERQTKRRIITTRFQRNLSRWLAHARRMTQPAGKRLYAWLHDAWRRLLHARDNLSQPAAGRGGDTADVATLFSRAEEAEKRQDVDAAEQCYIHIIGLDSKNVAAFKRLGQLYAAAGKYNEARETLEHVLKLTTEDAEVYNQLAEVATSEERLQKATEYYQHSLTLNSQNAQTHFHLAELHQSTGSHKNALVEIKAALAIEPKNPRYLDGLFHVGILLQDKAEALDAYKGLKAINPENAKLAEMKKKIDDL